MKLLIIISLISAILVINFKTIESNIAHNFWERSSGPWKQLFEAFRDGDLEKVEEEIRMGIDVNIKGPGNPSDCTALHVAAGYGHELVVKLLIDRGANISALDGIDRAPLHRAAINGSVPVVRLLIDKGASVNATEKNKWTPLHRAAINGHESVVKLLIDEGSNVTAVDKDGRSPLYWAAFNGHESVIKLLMGNGANNNNAADELRRASSSKERVKAVIGVIKANINTGDNHKSPWQRVAFNDQDTLAKLLRDDGAIRLTAIPDIPPPTHFRTVSIAIPPQLRSITIPSSSSLHSERIPSSFRPNPITIPSSLRYNYRALPRG